MKSPTPHTLPKDDEQAKKWIPRKQTMKKLRIYTPKTDDEKAKIFTPQTDDEKAGVARTGAREDLAAAQRAHQRDGTLALFTLTRKKNET